MRCLCRQKRPVLVSRFLGKTPAADEEGRLTGEYELSRSPQTPVWASLSGAAGSVEDAVFGQNVDYDRTLLIDDPDFEIEESSVLWVDCLPADFDASGEAPYTEQPFDYTVKRVSRTECYTAVAISRVEVSQ